MSKKVMSRYDFEYHVMGNYDEGGQCMWEPVSNELEYVITKEEGNDAWIPWKCEILYKNKVVVQYSFDKALELMMSLEHFDSGFDVSSKIWEEKCNKLLDENKALRAQIKFYKEIFDNKKRKM